VGIAQSLVAQLRRRVMDERVSRVAFRLQCIDEAATDCLISITNRQLQSNVLNGRIAEDLAIDLEATSSFSVKQLIEAINDTPGYRAVAESDIEPNHPADDLEIVGSMSIVDEAATLKHHLFSDDEMLEIVDNACRRHNVSYTPETLPQNEFIFVLMLGHAEVSRRLASDAAKRRNLQSSADQLLEVARDLEVAYANDIRRQQRAIPVPKLDENKVDQGDVVIGTFSRRSPRNGFMAPLSNEGLLTASKLLEIAPDDVEDTKVTLRWDRNSDIRFYSYELWRDTVPDVQRQDTYYRSNYHTSELLRLQFKHPSTSKLVYRSYGPYSSRDASSYMYQAGQLATTFVDVGSGDQAGQAPDSVIMAPPLEPDTVYYWRLYIIGMNYEVVPSNVVSAKTKSLRALFAITTPITPILGLAGSTFTVKGERFDSTVGLTLGGKTIVPTVLNPTTMTAVVPTFNSPAAKGTRYDAVLSSASGLKDVIVQAFQYTG